MADILIAEGFTSLEEVATPLQEMLEIEAFDETHQRAAHPRQGCASDMEIAREERVDDVSQDLRDWKG